MRPCSRGPRSAARLLPGLIAALALGTGAGSAFAFDYEDEETDARKEIHERGFPSINRGRDLYQERANGSLTTNIGRNISNFDPRGKTDPIYRVGGDLLTPRLFEMWGDPRAWLYAGAQLVFDEDRNAAGRIDPGLPAGPEAQVERNTDSGFPLPPATSVGGQGSRLVGTSRNRSWYAGVGFSLEQPVRSYFVRGRMAIEYTGEQIFTQATIVQVEEFLDVDGDVLLVQRLSSSSGQTYHSIGPAMEFEWVVKDTGLFGISLYTQLRYLIAVGDRDIEFRDPSETLDVRYERPGSRFRGGFGVRIGFFGFDR